MLNSGTLTSSSFLTFTMTKHFSIIVTLAVFLTACSTTVLTDEELNEVIPAPAIEEQDSAEVTEPSAETGTGDVVSMTADVASSFIAFTGSKGELVSHQGKFDSFEAEIQKTQGELSGLGVIIDISSMNTDSDGLTKHLLADDFFDAEAYPQATFLATLISNQGGGQYLVSGDLTLKGVSEKISFSATLTGDILIMNHVLDRTTFGIGGPAEGVKAIDAAVPIVSKLRFQ